MADGMQFGVERVNNWHTQRRIEGKVNILGGESTCSCEKKVHTNISLIMNSYRDRAVWISKINSVRFMFAGFDEKRSLQKKGGYTRRNARSRFGWCCPKKETWSTTQMNNTRIQINQPTGCNNFPSSLLDVYVRLNMFRASSRPSSEAQQLQ